MGGGRSLSRNGSPSRGGSAIRPGGFRRGFPDRQLIYRSRGEVKYFNFGWKSQTALALAVTALCGWLGYSGIELALMDDRLQGERDRAEALLRSNESLAERYAAAQDRMGELSDLLNGTEARLAQAQAEHRDLRYEIARLHGELVEAETGRQHSLDLFQGAEARKARIEQEIADLIARQAEVLRRAGRQTDREFSTLHGSLAMTGLDIDGLLKRILKPVEADADGIGGPFHADADSAGAMPVPAGEAAGSALVRAALTRADEPTGAFGAGVRALDMRFARLDALRVLMRHLPLVRPTDTGRFSSSYGYRKDPYTGRRAFHSGLDIADGKGTAVMATASGRVAFAGRKLGYGNVVEIDHGFDIVTRYAHLDRVLVTEGENVDFRDKIGTMGSSGRSTGTHLHYEIRYQDNALNPLNFIRAGRDVFRQSEDELQKVSQWQGDGASLADFVWPDDHGQP